MSRSGKHVGVHNRSAWERREIQRRLAQRDGPVCSICLEPMDMTLRDDSPQSVTVDHVIPQSKGGVNAFRNWKLAHKICNARKADS